MSNNTTGKGIVFIISGPAGSGKTTICDGLIEKESLQRIITSTTRSPRQGEINGLDYHFLTPDNFKRKIKEEGRGGGGGRLFFGAGSSATSAQREWRRRTGRRVIHGQPGAWPK